MPCTTFLAGKRATYDGSTFMARNEDSPSGQFTAKKHIVVLPQDQPRHYKSRLTRFEVDLPEEPMAYTAMPNALPDEGVWGEAGVNACNVSMTETETITSNARVLGADPLVPDGIGEEDLLTLVLPYVRSARDGVLRLGHLLEQYGTCEMNGIGFQDKDEVWWLESIGGHHWIARRVPDDRCVVMPNQQGIDWFDLADAFGEKREHLCAPDLLDFIRRGHLDPVVSRDTPLEQDRAFDARGAFGSREDADHTYNTPRAWFMLRYLAPSDPRWDDPAAGFGPESDRLPWSIVPERRVDVEDVKYLLSSHYQGTPYDPYGHHGDPALRGKYRSIGVNRNNFLSLSQLRPDLPSEIMAVEWIAMGSNPFNAFVPQYANVRTVPAYFSGTTGTVTTGSCYWASRLLGVMADAHYPDCSSPIERYQKAVSARSAAMLREFDEKYPGGDAQTYLEQCNQALADMARSETDSALDKVLYAASCRMKNGFSRSDA